MSRRFEWRHPSDKNDDEPIRDKTSPLLQALQMQSAEMRQRADRLHQISSPDTVTLSTVRVDPVPLRHRALMPRKRIGRPSSGCRFHFVRSARHVAFRWQTASEPFTLFVRSRSSLNDISPLPLDAKLYRHGMTLFAVWVLLLTVSGPNFVAGSAEQSTCAENEGCDVAETSLEANASPTTPSPPTSIAVNDAVTNEPQEHFRSLGNRAQDRPCCTSMRPGRVDCFIRGPRSTVLHISNENNAYSEWREVSETKITGEIECMRLDMDVMSILTMRTDTIPSGKTFSKGEWRNWEAPNTRFTEVPSCAVLRNYVIRCAMRGPTNAARQMTFLGIWSDTRDLGGSLSDPIQCASIDEDYFGCFASTTEMKLSWNKLRGGFWSGWQNLGGRVRGRPSVMAWDENRFDVFVLGSATNSVMQKRYDGQWHDWIDLGGVFDSAPECVTPGVGKIHCFAVGRESYLYRNSFDGTKWTGWIKSFGFFLETPSCVVSNKDEVTCAARRFNKEVVEITYRFS